MSTISGESPVAIASVEALSRCPRRQLQARGSSAIGPSEFVQGVVHEYISYIETEVLPRIPAGGKVYVASVVLPIVQDLCEPLEFKVGWCSLISSQISRSVYRNTLRCV